MILLFMSAKKRLKKYLTKGIRKLRYRKGFGVHSPFAYGLITQVIGEKSPFYDYEEIRRLRRTYMPKKRLVPGRIYRKGPSLKRLFLLFRLVNFFNPAQILELNNRGGVVTVILSMIRKEAHVVSLCGDDRKAELAAEVLQKENATNVTLQTGDFATLLHAMPESYQADFVVINNGLLLSDVDALFAALLPRMHSGTVVFLEKIHSDPQMHKLWRRFRLLPEVRTSMDLYEVGLVVFDDKRFKQHFIVSF